VACNATGIGMKGMLVAAKTMALTGIDLFTNPTYIQQAKEEHRKQVGNYQYKALLGNRKPALHYRD
jgi:aminobenzoyl-glutamate utilization protein B